MEERGVPVQEDWSMAPDEERVRFSLSGVAPNYKTTRQQNQQHMIPHTKTQTNMYTPTILGAM